MLGRDCRRCGYRAPASRRSLRVLLIAAPLVVLVVPWLVILAVSRTSTAAPSRAASGPPPAPTTVPTATLQPSPTAIPSRTTTAVPASVSSSAQPGATNPTPTPVAQTAGAATAGNTQGLSVIIGPSGGGVQAFFYWRGGYLGTDTLAPSGSITIGPATPDTITLQYKLYRPSDAACCPSGGAAAVRYHWDGTRLQPLDPIPTEDPRAPLSRR